MPSAFRANFTLFLPPVPSPPAPYCVFIHGGYWQALDVASSAYFADVVTSAGCHFVALGYDLAPKVQLIVMALDWAAENAV